MLKSSDRISMSMFYIIYILNKVPGYLLPSVVNWQHSVCENFSTWHVYDFFYFLFRLFKKWQTHLVFLNVKPNQKTLLLSKGQTLLKVNLNEEFRQKKYWTCLMVDKHEFVLLQKISFFGPIKPDQKRHFLNGAPVQFTIVYPLWCNSFLHFQELKNSVFGFLLLFHH